MGSRVWPSESLRNGLPSSKRFAAVVNLDTGLSIEEFIGRFAPTFGASARVS
ncbi:hypothetical protein NN3_61880 [Nocardia neocaledoniensis NBRC 108232]|nr:hypothetical protein NN3_61880 [Nocardia neocaledoniensis NBRC 108232]